jgi:hypothetical protein
MGKKDKFASEEEMQYHAIQTGLNNLIYSNQNLRENAVLMKNTIDRDKVNYIVGEIKEELEGKNVSPEQMNKIVYDNLVKYASSGEILKNTTIQTLFDKNIEGKLDRSVLEKIVNFFKPDKYGGVKYFEKALDTYKDMYDILSQNEEAQKEIPELTKAAKAMKMYGFLDATLNNFKAHGMMDDNKYKELFRDVYETTTIRSKKGMKGLEGYIKEQKADLEKEEEAEKKAAPEKIVAGILGGIGMIFMLLNIDITGAVIGEKSTVSIGIVGVLMIFFALLLFFRPLKKSFKN